MKRVFVVTVDRRSSARVAVLAESEAAAIEIIDGIDLDIGFIGNSDDTAWIDTEIPADRWLSMRVEMDAHVDETGEEMDADEFRDAVDAAASCDDSPRPEPVDPRQLPLPGVFARGGD